MFTIYKDYRYQVDSVIDQYSLIHVCLLGLVTHQMSGLKSPSSDCLSAKDICMSDLCSAEKTLQSSFCEENGKKNYFYYLFYYIALSLCVFVSLLNCLPSESPCLN